MTFNTGDCLIEVTTWACLTVFYCSKRQQDKTQVKQLRQSSIIFYKIFN